MNVAVVTRTKPAHPYPGLRPFEAHEWSIFFGRDRMIDEVIERLASNRLVLIHGASGSGKSSLVRAGVMPKLSRHYQRHGAPWLTCALRPSGGPLWNLATELAHLEGKADDLDRIGGILASFNRRDATLASVVESLDGMSGKSLCILVDQFEELFRFEKETSREEAELFVELISRALARDGEVDSGSADVHVVVTMRSEFLGECARFAGLAETINRTQYLVPRMDDDGLFRAVRRPAQMFGGSVPERLAERLIASVRGWEDELPLLQHGLMLMWDEAANKAVSGQQIVLDGAMVDSAGGLGELLSRHADRVMDRVASDASRARMVETVFRELTDVNAEGSAIRRPRRFRDLVAVVGGAPEELRVIIDAFRKPGVSFLTPYDPAPITDDTIIDISHEALIRCWRRIASVQDGWLKREFDDGLAWRSLLGEAHAFEENKQRVLSAAATQDRSKLFSARGEAWSERYGGGWSTVGGLLQASKKAATKARLRRRITFASLAGLTAVALVAAVIAALMYSSQRVTLADAQTAKTQAEAATRQAEAQNALSAKLLSQLTENGSHCPRGMIADSALITTAANAATHGNSGAASMLGYIYYCGLGISPDRAKAREWLEKAADAGDAPAMKSIGNLYYNGEGVPQDYVKAREWYARAAAAGDGTAMNNIGRLYLQGRGVSQDFVEARKWFEKAVAAGVPAAMSNMGILYRDGRGVTRDHAKARDWFEKAIAAGAALGMTNLGGLYRSGLGVPQDYDKARQWYEKAATAGEALAMRNLGFLYANGLGVAQDYAIAREWYEKALASGDADVMANIGTLYENKADAMTDIGLMYANGRGVPQDYNKAREWYEKAAAAGNSSAMRNLGLLYENGHS
ncbi:MAG: hypothetical protein QOH65_2158, partial [Methylobacteriaceae bacterium]|nr:hypothetical protein [Methylobacteriaceae bacterium]